jgi:cellulose biosynthesis protein BcsQ
VEVFRTVIRRGVAVDESSYARQPLFEYAPRSAPARDYEQLLREVRENG